MVPEERLELSLCLQDRVLKLALAEKTFNYK
jgi:hypothetical protein